MRFLRQTERIPDASQRAALRWRTLEHVLPVTKSAKPFPLTLDYLCASWVLRELHRWLGDVAYGVTRMDLHLSHQIDTHSDLSFSVDPDRVLELAGHYADVVPDGSIEQRMLLDARAFSTDRTARTDRIERLREAFQLNLRRAQRQRHALIHGRPVAEAVVSSVDGFMEGIAWLAVDAILRAEAFDEDLVSILAARRDQAERLLNQIETTGNVSP